MMRATPWVLLAFAGCATPTVTQSSGPNLRAARERLAAAAPEDHLLALMRYSLDALQLGEVRAAREAFQELHSANESVFGPTAAAERARQLWYGERCKEFRGEPYERSMVAYYRGLVELLLPDPMDLGNAQAAFGFGAWLDGFAEEQLFVDDFALLHYLRGVARTHLGERALATESFARVAELRPDAPEYLPEHNVLLVVETGLAPKKVTDGRFNAELRFVRARGFGEDQVEVTVDGARFPVYPMEDVWWQATTRGGRLVDAINRGKAQWASTADDVGTSLSVASSVMIKAGALVGGEAKPLVVAGAAAGLAGGATLLAASMVDASADDRAWDNLPDAVHVLPLHLAPGLHHLEFTFASTEGRASVPAPKVLDVEVGRRPLQVVWVRSRLKLTGVKP